MNDSNPSSHNKSEHAMLLSYKTLSLLQTFCFFRIFVKSIEICSLLYVTVQMVTIL